MTGIAPVSPASPSRAEPPPEKGVAAITSDFETFLRMLTVQAQNQDPLNPLDSTDFAVQLATFSGVEQQVRTNDLLESMTGTLAGNELAQLASWVGMEARSASPAAFSGAPIRLDAAPERLAARAEMRVYDERGQLWDRFDVPATPGQVIWEGTRADGSMFPPGLYTFEVRSLDAEGSPMATTPAQTYNRVIEAQAGPAGAELLLANGTYVPADSVTALRDASATRA